MTPLLIDANLSPDTAVYLRSALGFDAVHLRTLGLGELSDDEVVALAKREGRVVITFDLDYGEIYRRWESGHIGVILLRLEDQTASSVNGVLARFFRLEAAAIDIATSLVVLDGARTRVVTAQ